MDLSGHSLLVASNVFVSTVTTSVSNVRTLSAANAAFTTSVLASTSLSSLRTGASYTPAIPLRFVLSSSVYSATQGTVSLGTVSGTQYNGYSFFVDVVRFPLPTAGQTYQGNEQIEVFSNGTMISRSWKNRAGTTVSAFRAAMYQTNTAVLMTTSEVYTITASVSSATTAITVANTESFLVMGWLVPPVPTLTGTLTV